ncbi:normal mucosa of esophagus-specific gene 1 protein isoform X1 [Ahaetulla prasina]|uniref:normal mucosa of esophagus-specific gene 1 protein isoform X1 n=1 Tax=Ahaetulla prasina TaxID=499056 RepID=UPI0026496AE4|nr:normal mucosa of esophagus-specific gene 1 protein isoform X1 [Ahaetulla prasina]
MSFFRYFNKHRELIPLAMIMTTTLSGMVYTGIRAIRRSDIICFRSIRNGSPSKNWRRSEKFTRGEVPSPSKRHSLNLVESFLHKLEDRNQCAEMLLLHF